MRTTSPSWNMGERLVRIALAVLLAGAAACAWNAPPSDAIELTRFATRYAAAWSSQEAASVAAFYADSGSININGSPPSVGRAAVAADAQGFMTAFPDMVVALDSLVVVGEHPRILLDGDRHRHRHRLAATSGAIQRL